MVTSTALSAMGNSTAILLVFVALWHHGSRVRRSQRAGSLGGIIDHQARAVFGRQYRAARLADDAPVAILGVQRADDTIVYANTAAASTMRRTLDELIGLPLQQLIDGPLPPSRTGDEEADGCCWEAPARLGDGTTTRLQVWERSSWLDGEPARLFVVQDVADRHRQEVDRQKALDALEQGIAERTRMLQREIAERRYAETALQEANELLEKRVQDRTEALGAEVAERRRVELALRDSHELVRSLLDSTSEGIVGIDLNGRCTFCNAAALRLLGYEATDTLIGKDFRALVHHTRKDGRPCDAAACPVCEPIRSGESTRSDSEVFWRRDGRPVPVAFAARPTVREGVTVGAVASFWDITDTIKAAEERSRLETQLRHAQKMETIGTLAGGIAHDFNNILTPIYGYSHMALDQVENGSQLHEDLAEIARSATRAKELVEKILTFSRRVELECRPLRLEPVIEGALRLFRVSLPSGIDVRTRIEAGCRPVMGDGGQFEHVLLNLFTNAVQAMREGGGILEIGLSMELLGEAGTSVPLPQGTYVRLSVRDTGHGMDEATRVRIFDPFFTTKAAGEGTGLGLATVHGIITGYGGTIHVDSTPGEGTTFRVYLPAVADAEPQVTVAERPPPRGTEHILFVDDQPANGAVAKRMIERLGYRVSMINDSRDAWDTFQQQSTAFDLVITDHKMPGLSGRELASRILGLRPSLPIIMISGYGTSLTAEVGAGLRVRQVLRKPLDEREMAKAIRRALDET